MNNYTNIVGVGSLQVFKYGTLNDPLKMYVSPAGIDNASRTGSAADPFATLPYAVSRASAGQVIYLNEGIYNLGIVKLSVPLGISIQGAGIGRTIILTSFTSANNEGAIDFQSPAGAILNGNQFMRDLTIDGNSQTASIAVYFRYRQNCTLVNVAFTNFWNSGATFSNNQNINVEPAVGYSSNNNVFNCSFVNCGSELSTQNTLGFYDQQNGIIDSCYFDNTIRPEGSNVQTQIRPVWVRNVAITNNTHKRHDHELARWNFFIEVWNYTGNLFIRDNKYYGRGTIDLGGNGNRCDVPYLVGCEVAYNKFLNTSSTQFTFAGNSLLKVGIDLEGDGHSYVFIHHNEIQYYGWPIYINTANAAGVSYVMSHIYVYANLITNVGFSDNIYSRGIKLLNETPAVGQTCMTEFLKIFNNTIIGIVNSQRGIDIEARDNLRYCEIVNNIVRGFNNEGIQVIDTPPNALTTDGLRINNNELFGNGTNVPVISGTITQNDTDTTGNINNNPLFLSALDFHLQGGSPCRNTGLPVFGYDKDFDNVPINSRPSIGCYTLNV